MQIQILAEQSLLFALQFVPIDLRIFFMDFVACFSYCVAIEYLYMLNDRGDDYDSLDLCGL